jgi:hypothetical protein
MAAMDVLWFVRVGEEVLLPANLYAPDEIEEAEVVLVRLFGLPVRMINSPFLWQCPVFAGDI